MCHWVRCPNCLKARIGGCGDEEHEQALLAGVSGDRLCRCKEQQLAEMAAQEERNARKDGSG